MASKDGPAKPRRPFAVTSLAGLVLTLTGMQILRAWAVLSNWDFYSSLPLNISPLFLAVSGLFWGGLGAFLLRGVWRGKDWAPRITRWAALGFAFFGLVDRAILQTRGPQDVTWPFDLVLTFVLLASVFGILSLPKTKAFFGAEHGR